MIVESAVALWLLSGVALRFCWAVAMAMFTAFLVASVHSIVVGTASCGCFGHVTVSPWWTLILNSLVLTGLVLVGPFRGTARAAKPNRSPIGFVTGLLALWGVIALPASFLMIAGPGTQPVRAGVVLTTDGTRVLDPQLWVGGALPVVDYLEHGDKLRRGRWMVLFYDHGCSLCHDLLESPTRVSLVSTEPAQQLAVILVEDKGPSLLADSFSDGVATLVTSPRGDENWLVETPCLVALDDGQVIATWPRSHFAKGV